MIYGKAKIVIDPDWDTDAKTALGFTLERLFRATGLFRVASNLDFMIEELNEDHAASYKFRNCSSDGVVRRANKDWVGDPFPAEALGRNLNKGELGLMRLYVANYMKENGKKIILEIMEINEEKEKFTLHKYFADDKLKFEQMYKVKLHSSIHDFVHRYEPTIEELRHRLLQKTKNKKRLDLSRVHDLAEKLLDGSYVARKMSMFINWDEEIDLP